MEKIQRKGIYGVNSLYLTTGTTTLPAEAADIQSTKHPYPVICCKAHPTGAPDWCSHLNTHQVSMPNMHGVYSNSAWPCS